jgi:uncharacterized spore protein YtfJ
MSVDVPHGSALADELLQRIGRIVRDGANVTSVFGQPVERDGVTVIPVARARFGFGGGGGAGGHEGAEGSGGGGGAGAFVSPVGYIELRGGTAQFKRITTPFDLLAGAAAAAVAVLAVKRLLAD